MRISIDDLEELVVPLEGTVQDSETYSHLTHCAVCIEIVPQVSRASNIELNTRIVSMLYPVAALALDAVVHIILEVLGIFNVEFHRSLRSIKSAVGISFTIAVLRVNL